MSQARILHLRSGTHLFGPERVILSLAHYASDDFQPVVGGLGSGKQPLLLHDAAAAGLETFWLETSGRLDFRAVHRLADYITQNNIALVHAHDFKADFYALAARRRVKAPLVTTLHLWNHNSLRTSFYEAIDALQVRYFDRIICVSPEIARDAQRWRVPAAKLRVILNGVDTRRFRPLSPRFANRQIVIGSIGRLVSQKGYDNFLQAAAQVSRQAPHARFLLVGDGPLRAELEAQAARLGISDCITFGGQRDPIEASYGELDIFVSSSYSEGLPIAVLEAMASRLPVIATRVGATPDVIEDGSSGILISPGNIDELTSAIMLLLRDSDLALALAQAAYERAKTQFSAEAMTRQTEAVYKEILDAKTRH